MATVIIKPLPFRSSAQVVPRTTRDWPNWVGVGNVNDSALLATFPTPSPSPEGEGGK